MQTPEKITKPNLENSKIKKTLEKFTNHNLEKEKKKC
jgi:hypothetical protein